MIEPEEIFLGKENLLALWGDENADSNDLAAFASKVLENNVEIVSVCPNNVDMLWVWLEYSNVKLFPRFQFDSDKYFLDTEFSSLVTQINTVTKRGATGIQIFVEGKLLDKFFNAFSVVCNDLFFDHDLCLGVDICDIETQELKAFFQKLKNINVKTLILTLKEDLKDMSDFIGRIYGLLEVWDFDGDLQFAPMENYERMDQALRLIEILRPELLNRVHFFVKS